MSPLDQDSSVISALHADILFLKRAVSGEESGLNVFDTTDVTMKILAYICFLLASSAALAGSSTGYGSGGWFERFDPIVEEHNRTGELFRIEGHCQSACTLFLGIRNVCVDPAATLLFHAGHDRSRNIDVTSTHRMLSAYSDRLRDYLVSNGVMDTLAFHAISGRDLIQKFDYRACSGI